MVSDVKIFHSFALLCGEDVRTRKLSLVLREFSSFSVFEHFDLDVTCFFFLLIDFCYDDERCGESFVSDVVFFHPAKSM